MSVIIALVVSLSGITAKKYCFIHCVREQKLLCNISGHPPAMFLLLFWTSQLAVLELDEPDLTHEVFYLTFN